ncbi:LADA_0G00782g1_1 [Lachancea dasiensis]|uniref:LADA_0G00782g1_1 n=1 Tax=Lachancea dasiensis TaxID=1072105 RepID=A0A1G4JQC2_9SACH|nr:LADA_0G00782g1_1 [Lachancea dasiensis]
MPLLLSVSQRYVLADMAQRKLLGCALNKQNTDLDLRILVGHANLLDRLSLEERRADSQCAHQEDVDAYNCAISGEYYSDSESDSDSDQESTPDDYSGESDPDQDLGADSISHLMGCPVKKTYRVVHSDSGSNAEHSFQAATTTLVAITEEDELDADDEDDAVLERPVPRYLSRGSVVSLC